MRVPAFLRDLDEEEDDAVPATRAAPPGPRRSSGPTSGERRGSTAAPAEARARQGRKGAPLRRPATGPFGRWSTRKTRALAYLMLVYGVALIVATLALWYITVPTGGPAAPVPCGLGTLPPAPDSPNASLSATPSTFPPPANGSAAAESITLWINTTDRTLPGTVIDVVTRPLGGQPSGPTCTLPIPAASWTSSSGSLTVDPNRHYTTTLTGVPATPYARSGVFAVLVTVNQTAPAGSFGSTHAILSVA